MSDYEELKREIRDLRRMVYATVLAVGCLCVWTLAHGQERVPTPSEAVGWALGDLATVAETDRPFQRYVWIPPWGSDQWVPAIDYAINTAVSHSAVIQLGTPVANGWLLRYDLRRLAPSQQQFTLLQRTWDGLATQDPYFHVPAATTGVNAAVLAPHLQQAQALALAGLSFSTGAIYRADFLIVKALSTLEGGQYYEFLQVPGHGIERDAKFTPQDQWLATLGVFEQTTKGLNGDQRSAIFRSAVTGKPRRIDVFYGLGRGGNLCTITHDVADEDVDATQHPIRNLLAFVDSAREIIVERPNGTHAFALTNNRGEFVDAAPDNVARDTTIPPPHTARLQPAISCIRCHGPYDGFQPFGNDVQKLLSSRVDVFADVAGAGLTREQAIDRLAGLYAGQLDEPDAPIGRARRDYAAVCYKLLGPVNPFAAQAEVSPVRLLSDTLAQMYASYRYDLVTSERAALELGSRGGNLDVLLGQQVVGVVVDPVTATLLVGLSVNRSDFETVYADMAAAAAREQER